MLPEPDHPELLPLFVLVPELMTLFDFFYFYNKNVRFNREMYPNSPIDISSGEMKRKIKRILRVFARKQQIYDGFYGSVIDFFRSVSIQACGFS